MWNKLIFLLILVFVIYVPVFALDYVGDFCDQNNRCTSAYTNKASVGNQATFRILVKNNFLDSSCNIAWILDNSNVLYNNKLQCCVVGSYYSDMYYTFNAVGTHKISIDIADLNGGNNCIFAKDVYWNVNVYECLSDSNCPSGKTCVNNICKSTAVCGDFVCSAGETCSDSRDVASCTDNMCYEPVCSNGCGQAFVANGQEDEKCSGSYHCDGSGNCILDSYCGDGICNNGEVPYTCTQDCGKCMSNSDCNDSNPSTEDVCLHQASPASVCKNTPYCGNNVCDSNETCSSCSQDCGACPTGTVVTDVKETTTFGTDSLGIFGPNYYFYQVFTLPIASNIDTVKLRVFDIGNPSSPLTVELRKDSPTGQLIASANIYSSQTNTRSGLDYPYSWVTSSLSASNLQAGKYTIVAKCTNCHSSSSEYAANKILAAASSSDYGMECYDSSCLTATSSSKDYGVVVYASPVVQQQCEILSTSWSTNQTSDNQTVQMYATTNVYCAGKNIKFDIWEDDGIFPHDFIETKVPSSSSSYQFYDSFDDNDLADWNTNPKPCTTCEKPVISGGIISGKYSGYSVDPYTNWMIKPVSMSSSSFEIEFRGTSGSQWPNAAVIHLLDPSYSGQTKGYSFVLYGESGTNRPETQSFELRKDDQIIGKYRIGSDIYSMHTYKISRDSSGKWRFWIDGVEKQHTFPADVSYNTLGFIAVNLHRDQSKFDWIKLSGGDASSTLSAQWKAVWQPDQGGGDPEFYFEVFVDGVLKITSPNMKVTAPCTIACNDESVCDDGNPITMDVCEYVHTCESKCVYYPLVSGTTNNVFASSIIEFKGIDFSITGRWDEDPNHRKVEVKEKCPTIRNKLAVPIPPTVLTPYAFPVPHLNFDVRDKGGRFVLKAHIARVPEKVKPAGEKSLCVWVYDDRDKSPVCEEICTNDLGNFLRKLPISTATGAATGAMLSSIFEKVGFDPYVQSTPPPLSASKIGLAVTGAAIASGVYYKILSDTAVMAPHPAIKITALTILAIIAATLGSDEAEAVEINPPMTVSVSATNETPAFIAVASDPTKSTATTKIIDFKNMHTGSTLNVVLFTSTSSCFGNVLVSSDGSIYSKLGPLPVCSADSECYQEFSISGKTFRYVKADLTCSDAAAGAAIYNPQLVSGDADNDGYSTNDCNDNDASVNPGVADSICNGIDNNCNGIIDDQYVKRSCGTGACSGQTSCTSGSEICSGPAPSQEVCDNIDNDCDGYTDENVCAVQKYLWNADSNSDKIYKLSTTGALLKSFAAPAYSSSGMAFDGTNLWVSDYGTDKIYKISVNGAVLSSFKAPNTNIRDLSYDGTYLWTVDASAKKIYKITTTGVVLSIITAPDSSAKGIAYDSGYLWIAGDYSNKIYKITATGTVVTSFPSPSTTPTGIAVEGAYLWIADAGSDKLYKTTKSGSVMSSFKSPYTYPTGLAVE